MKLVSNTPCDITEYCGNLIVTYLSDDKKDVQPLLNSLKESGYEYIENEVGLETIIKGSYLSDKHDQLRICGRYILFVTENLQKPENRVLRNCIFYQIGYLTAKRPHSIILYAKNEGLKNAMAGTPHLKDLSANWVTESVKNNLASMNASQSAQQFSSVVMQNKFYTDDTLNRLTKDRIEYRRLVVTMDITEEDFKAAYDLYRSITTDLSLSEPEFINKIQSDMSCGARILSFGTENKLTTHLFPYAAEQVCKDTEDFPTNFSCAHVFRHDKDKRDDLKAMYTLEYILPIHKLLGVNFKLFIRAEKDEEREMYIEVLEALFRSNFKEKNDKHTRGNTLFFSLDFPNAEPFPFNHGLDIGDVADYLYPQ